MKKGLYLAACLVCMLACASQAVAQERRERLREYVEYFASDSLRGRAAGSADAARARDFIVERYKECGLEPFFSGSFLLPFDHEGGHYTDVVGLIPGNGLKDEYIVLGAHYDHLGVKGGKIYPGADDNASGSAALIEVAQQLSQERAGLQRSVIIAAFDGEELGLYGSNYLAKFIDDIIGLEHVRLMMSVDMVGRYADTGHLTLEGTATIRDGRRLALEGAEHYSIKLRPKAFETSVLTATDTQGFAQKQVPTLAVSTGLHPQYHKPSDTADRIDYNGLDAITGYLGDFALHAASDPDFAPSGKVARKHRNQAPLLEAGITASIGQASLSFKDAGYTMNASMDYSAGVISRFNFGRVGLQLEGLYEKSESFFPDVDAALGTPRRYGQRAVTVPLYFQLRSGGGDNHVFFGVGGYWSHVLSHSFSKADPLWNVQPDQGGLALNFGMQVGHVLFSWDFRHPLTDAFPGHHSARLNTATYLKAAWMF